MADIKFACPHCQQHIQAEPGYAGMQISCPACGGSLTVPGSQGASAPTVAAIAGKSAVAPVPVPAYVSPQGPAAGGCPSCGGALPRGALLCTHCGYNLATGQRTVAGRPAALGKPAKVQDETPWYKTVYPYLGVVVLVLVTLYYLGRTNPIMMLACIGAAVVYSLTAHIIVAVAAFKESAGTGFLALCIPLYAVYYVYKVSQSETLKLIYSVAVIINIALRLLNRLA